MIFLEKRSLDWAIRGNASKSITPLRPESLLQRLTLSTKHSSYLLRLEQDDMNGIISASSTVFNQRLLGHIAYLRNST